MEETIFNVLFICTGNSARSIFAEKLVDHLGAGRFKGFSAGTQPKDKVHPLAVEVLAFNKLSTEDISPKSIDEFTHPHAPEMDFIFIVCDKESAEPCLELFDESLTVHWNIPSPSAMAKENDIDKIMAFRTVFKELEKRISIFVNLPFQSLDNIKLQKQLEDLSQTIP